MILIFFIITRIAFTNTESYFDINLERIKSLDKYFADTREDVIEPYVGNSEHNKMVWRKYYLCLQKQHEAIGKKRVLVPEAMSILEGQNAHMDCRLCLYPGDDVTTATWYWDLEKIPTDDNTIFDGKGRLSIYGLRLEQSGFYECRIGSTRSRPYFLHVVPDAEEALEVKPASAKVGPFSHQPETALEVLDVFTHWNPWSECSRCDSVGRKYRFGVCTVALKDIEQSKSLSSDMEVLHLFVVGLPCLSPLLPKIIRHNDVVKNRKNEIMSAFCKDPCTDDVFEVKNVFGETVETANNSAGVYSLLQGPPPIPPLPGRMMTYAVIGKPVTLYCPGVSFSDLPYRWAIGKRARIAPWLAKNESKGRVTINAKQRLVFTKIQAEDERLYSCWQGENFVGVVRLLVIEDQTLKVTHHIVLLGGIVILGTFFYVFMRIFMNRKKAASIYY